MCSSPHPTSTFLSSHNLAYPSKLPKYIYNSANMKPASAVIISHLVTALAAPTWTGTGPPDVVRRSDTWIGSRGTASLNQAQVEQIGKDIRMHNSRSELSRGYWGC
ncbi:hypothetical protein VFPPC_17556 [Pochonia chlamydosporia 170]|uniref:Uncharacterized protein n=1 Tax=Pochonia chlamydosporia 170 TaxID=1380566 RepID=A0A219AR88_METCM|nr:hypothetical protein VFPPC_17556 [Pochonia chlamydosporia 170]OWT43281.1 hypothetical protein VFPPC_17556 [Pochonia chlamydosporia 170]